MNFVTRTDSSWNKDRTNAPQEHTHAQQYAKLVLGIMKPSNHIQLTRPIRQSLVTSIRSMLHISTSIRGTPKQDD